MTITAYCPCKICCGNGATGLAANGKPPSLQTCAGPRRYPFGTVVTIEGIGRRILTDRLAKRYDNRIDLFFPTHQEAKAFGIREAEVSFEPPPAS
jgi:3D (Asp-Asp-Asp) domain-containing protein